MVSNFARDTLRFHRGTRFHARGPKLLEYISLKFPGPVRRRRALTFGSQRNWPFQLGYDSGSPPPCWTRKLVNSVRRSVTSCVRVPHSEQRESYPSYPNFGFTAERSAREVLEHGETRANFKAAHLRGQEVGNFGSVCNKKSGNFLIWQTSRAVETA